MSTETRAQKIESYGSAYETLVAGLERFPREMWDFRAEPGSWSIREHVVHITDSEVNSYVRCRRFIAEPGQPLMAYDQDIWASALDYSSRNTDDALDLFRLLRRQTYAIVRSLPESAWANTCYHPENGDMTLDDWLDVYDAHIPEHLGGMQENYDAWLKATGSET